MTFDVRKGYNIEGYRNQVVKLWCADKKNTREDRRADPAGVGYDIPDFMTVNGRYTSRMSTKERIYYIYNGDFALGSRMNNNQKKFLKKYIYCFDSMIYSKKRLSAQYLILLLLKLLKVTLNLALRHSKKKIINIKKLRLMMGISEEISGQLLAVRF